MKKAGRTQRLLVYKGPDSAGKMEIPGQLGAARRVTHTTPAEAVFDLVIREGPEVGWRVYRAERLPSLYPWALSLRDHPATLLVRTRGKS